MFYGVGFFKRKVWDLTHAGLPHAKAYPEAPRVAVGGEKGRGMSSLKGGLIWSRRCSRDTYPESCITKYTRIQKNCLHPNSILGIACSTALDSSSERYSGTSLIRNRPLPRTTHWALTGVSRSTEIAPP